MTDKEQTLAMWLEGVKDAQDTAEILFKNKVYHHALFYCQLALEKRLKAIIVQYGNKTAPYIHDLVDLADFAQIKLTNIQIQQLHQISEFNLAARYNVLGASLAKLANRKYFLTWYKIVKETFVWLDQKYPQS